MSVQLDEGVVHETSKHSMLCADNPGDIAVEQEDNGTDIGLRLVEPVALKLSKLDSTKHPQPIISELVQKHDLGLLKFDTGTGKAVVSDAVRTEIVKLGAMYFQNREGPFLPTNNRSMTKSWFKKKLGDGRGEEVTRSWLAYSPAKKGSILHLESFLGFIHVKNKDAESFVDVILGKLEEDRMNLQDCRSQCYDNAAVMAGQKSGVSQRIAEKNKLAIFVNCDNHSLNLVGVHAAKEEAMMMTFLGPSKHFTCFFLAQRTVGRN
ncbi:hypothetical protein MRX96_058488 [Rhipicephalus microplus]